MCITCVTPFLAAKTLLESLEHSNGRGSTMDDPFISKTIRLHNEMRAEGCPREPNRSRGLATFPADYFRLLKHKKVYLVLSNDSCYILKLKKDASPGAEKTALQHVHTDFKHTANFHPPWSVRYLYLWNMHVYCPLQHTGTNLGGTQKDWGTPKEHFKMHKLTANSRKTT